MWLLIDPNAGKDTGKTGATGIGFVPYLGTLENVIGKEIFIRKSPDSKGPFSFISATDCIFTDNQYLNYSDKAMVTKNNDIITKENQNVKWIIKERIFVDRAGSNQGVKAQVIESVLFPGRFLSLFQYQSGISNASNTIIALVPEIDARVFNGVQTDPQYYSKNGAILFNISKRTELGSSFLLEFFYGQIVITDNSKKFNLCNSEITTSLIASKPPVGSLIPTSYYQQFMIAN